MVEMIWKKRDGNPDSTADESTCRTSQTGTGMEVSGAQPGRS